MGEHQLKEETAMQQQQSAAFAHSMATVPAVLVNGFSLGTVGRMVRLTMTEGVVPQLPPHVRVGVTMHPEDLAQLVRGGQELLGKMQEAGLWAPAPEHAVAEHVSETLRKLGDDKATAAKGAGA